ncbi:hypothetical protein ES332_D08G023800v1 [Gossypium tomentosum]|uniref:Leucine-rich repeat-containing N-terminal plant-type domain-containing protein n=1 Tax=Gossypium tomentosum TaxID=34277 RepID=A0A5D2JNU4_GOSTO|nr:hypothetical protein ES332_D08G023800v1 [Gossypium tomentosum]
MGSLCLVLVVLQLSWTLSSSVPPPSSHLCLPHQRDALLHFKTTMSVDCDLNPDESLNKSIDCCSWEGVKCDHVTGHVIGIDLSQSCLVGSLFANNDLFQLQNLQWLDLSYNYLEGSLIESTRSLFHFHGLRRLNLSGNGFDGTISSKLFSQLVSLTHLNLSDNAFSGLISHQISYLPNTDCSSGLELLDLSHCGFRGPIPATFGNLTKIISVYLQGNSLEGQIPDVFRDLRKLISLSFSSCNLSSPLPTTIFNLTKITYLDLSKNHLEGPFPNYVSGLQFLEKLRLFNNSIIPSWLFTLQSLPLLDLRYNKLVGPIDQIQKPSSIQEVDLSYNNIGGPIPNSIFNLVNLTRLDLSSNNLSGPIPGSIFDLVNLCSLYLSPNNLSGVIKSDMLSKLTSLEILDLKYVIFSGCSVRQFPNFFQTSKLWVLDLSNNMISGGISKWEAEGWEGLLSLNFFHNFLTTLEEFPENNLRFLNLHSNLLQVSILSTCLNPQIPISKELSMIIISKNKFTANIPSSICNLSRLNVLDLSENNVSGTIPDCLGNFSYLDHLLLNDNQLEGLVPPSLANFTSLELLNLGNNKLTDRFPRWLDSILSLQVLILRFNRFYGSLPHSIASSSFSTLRIIDLSGNKFTGTLSTKLLQNLGAMKDKPKDLLYSHFLGINNEIPVNVTTERLEMELTKILDIFVSMDLSNNQFCGKIPKDVEQFISLQMLNFSHNNFSDPISTSFGNLVALKSLDLSSNKLSGRIPSQMTKLTFLEVLDLSNNNFIGQISHGNQFDTFDNDSYSGNLGLCGLPLSKQCVDHGNAELSLPLVVEHGNAELSLPLVVEHEGSEIPFFWQVVMMGYESGVVLGLSLGYIVFTTERPWWFVRKVDRQRHWNSGLNRMGRFNTFSFLGSD